MCGINLSLPSKIYKPQLDIDRMNNAIKHRGLPGMVFSQTVAKGVHLGHVRLPILGLDDRFNQPYETDEWIFAFNGEIFNYKRFKADAESDVEVVASFLEMSVENPTDILGWQQMKHFDGFWSIIAFHKDSGQVVVVTDPLAKKPLYMHVHSHSVSSELKAFKGADLTLNPHYFAAVQKWGYAAKDITPFNEIVKIPRGVVMVIDPMKGPIFQQRYIDFEPDPKVNIREALDIAVHNRLVSDVPVSVLLSGGVDSSIIYKLMEEETHDFTIFHIENDESNFLDYLDIPSDIPIKYLDLKFDQTIDEVIYANDGPVDLGSMLPQYRMAEAIADAGLKVCITGDGADEVFGGYRRQFEYDAQYSDIFDELVYYHLPRLDKMSMRFTTELRSPFLNRDVIQAGLALPYEDRIDKNGLKKCFEDLIPDEILYRKKHPLKSKQVLSGNKWRYSLSNIFKERVANEY